MFMSLSSITLADSEIEHYKEWSSNRYINTSLDKRIIDLENIIFTLDYKIKNKIATKLDCAQYDRYLTKLIGLKEIQNNK